MTWQRIRKDGTPAKPPGRKPNPEKPKKEPFFVKGVLRPQVWVSGPDEFRHSMYTPWMRARAQANFREEGWDMSFDEFYDLWKDYWKFRGRGAEDYCMSRKDSSKPWTADNAIIITRQEHLINQGFVRKASKMKYNKPPKKVLDKPVVYKKMKVDKPVVYKKMKVDKNGK